MAGFVLVMDPTMTCLEELEKDRRQQIWRFLNLNLLTVI